VVSVVTFGPATGDAYQLDPRVKRVGMNLEMRTTNLVKAISNNLRKVRMLRRVFTVNAPHVVISFMDKANILSLFAQVGLRLRLIISERTHPSYQPVGGVWAVLRRLTYRRADALIVQSEGVRVWARGLIAPQRVHVIPNAVGTQFSAPVDAGRPRGSVILAVGRLSREKGFDILIEAFAKLAITHPRWSLMIVGDGPCYARLQRLASELLPPSSFLFTGKVQQPEQYYRTAEIFVLSSRYEGFPNALLEAMACGCAVIAADAPGGTKAIVRDGIDGVLVPVNDPYALTTAMVRLMNDEDLRSRLRARAVEVSSRFGMERVAQLWDQVIAATSPRF